MSEIPLTLKKTKFTNSIGRRKKPIWNFFKQGEEIDKGHYVTVCLACNETFQPRKTAVMEKHIMNDCSKVDNSICDAVIYMVETRQAPPNFTGTKHKNSQIESDQTTLDDFYENSDLMKEWKEVIDKILIKAFVCCDLPWHLIEHPFIVKLFKQLWLNYNPPNWRTLTDTLLMKEILRVSVKCYNLLDNESNLTLGKNFILLYYLRIIIYNIY